MSEVIAIDEEFELQVKRLCLPVRLALKCPKCKITTIKDLNREYLSYPIVNRPEELYHCCPNCENEFDTKITLKMTMEVG